MYTKKITYTDYNGIERTELACFNITEAELAELNLTTEGGYQDYLRRIVEAHNTPALVKEFKRLITMSYGVKSDDGRRFIKKDELTDEFFQTEAYSKFFMELATDEEALTAFVLGIIPEKYRSQVEEARKGEMNA